MYRTLLAIIGALGLLLFGPSPASALATLSFDNPNLDGGTLTYDGAGGPAIATGVIFEQVIGVGTPLNAGVALFCVPSPCLLDFTTGANLTEGPPVYTFAGGGSLSLTGGLNTAADGSGVQVAPAATLLAAAGLFDGPELVLANAATSNALFLGDGADLKDSTLAGFYGLGDAFHFAITALSLGQTTFDASGGFTAIVTDADFQNTAVPWPWSGVLLGLGVLGLARWRVTRGAA